MVGQGKRFIAGAVCPQCRLEDRILVYRDEEGDCRECVACGWRERRAESSAARPRNGVDAAAEPVRLMVPRDVPKSG